MTTTQDQTTASSEYYDFDDGNSAPAPQMGNDFYDKPKEKGHVPAPAPAPSPELFEEEYLDFTHTGKSGEPAPAPEMFDDDDDNRHSGELVRAPRWPYVKNTGDRPAPSPFPRADDDVASSNHNKI